MEDVGSGLLLKPETAQAQLEREQEAAHQTSSHPAADSQSGAHTGADGSRWDSPDGAAGSPATTDPSGSPIGQPDPRPAQRYFGTVSLNAASPSTQMGVILEEVIAHLNGAGARVTLTLDIEATSGDGFSKRVQQIIEQNARDLKFEQSRFEEE